MNPLFQKVNNNKPNMADFKAKLNQMDKGFMDRMIAEARKRGISEMDIQRGMQMINAIKQ